MQFVHDRVARALAAVSAILTTLTVLAVPVVLSLEEAHRRKQQRRLDSK